MPTKTKTTLTIALLALIGAVSVPLYVSYEHEKALENKLRLETLASKNRANAQTNGCVDDSLRVSDYSGAIAVSIPVWSNGYIVKCDNDNIYSLNGVTLSQNEVDRLVYETLTSQQRGIKHRARGDRSGGIPIYDPAHL